MKDIYRERRLKLSECRAACKCQDDQRGLLVAVAGTIAGLDLLPVGDTYPMYHNKLLESYALDAIDRFEPNEEHKVRRGDVTAFLKDSLSTEIESRPSVALGTDNRIASDKMTGFALTLDGQVLHLALFGKNGDGKPGARRDSRMQRPSARRRRRGYQFPEE